MSCQNLVSRKKLETIYTQKQLMCVCDFAITDNNQFLKTSSLVPGYETGGKDD